MLVEFHDPRIFPGAAAHSAADGCAAKRSPLSRLENQLAEAALECATRARCLSIDREADTIAVSSIFRGGKKSSRAKYATRPRRPLRREAPSSEP